MTVELENLLEEVKEKDKILIIFNEKTYNLLKSQLKNEFAVQIKSSNILRIFSDYYSLSFGNNNIIYNIINNFLGFTKNDIFKSKDTKYLRRRKISLAQSRDSKSNSINPVSPENLADRLDEIHKSPCRKSGHKVVSCKAPSTIKEYIDYWNSKELRKLKEGTKTYRDAVAMIRKLRRGELFRSTAYYGQKFSFPAFRLAVDRFEEMVNFEDVEPPDKKHVKSLSLATFIHNPFAKFIHSYFLVCLDREPRPLVKTYRKVLYATKSDGTPYGQPIEVN